jgi:hypothetical protein
MWISKAKYKAKMRRLEKLEDEQAITFGVQHYALHYDKFLPMAEGYHVTGKSESVNELVCAIANHLGFKYESPGKGGIIPPAHAPLPEVKPRK